MNVTMERISCILELKKMLLIGYGAVKWKDVIWQFVTGKGVLRYSLAEDLQKTTKTCNNSSRKSNQLWLRAKLFGR